MRCVGQFAPAIIAFVAAHSERVASMVDVLDASRFSSTPHATNHTTTRTTSSTAMATATASAMAWRSGPRRGAGGTALEA